jgi:small GTP-binding protein
MNSDIPNAHDRTIEDRFKTTLSINGQEITIDILDTAGEEDYQNMFDMWIKHGDAFFLVFAINDEESFSILEKKREKIIKMKGKNIPIVLIGNKIDLDNQRVVKFNYGENLSKKINCKFFETSTKDNINVEQVFETISLLTYKFCKENKLLFNQSFSLNNQKEKKKSCC